VPRPAPKRRADTPAAISDTESVGGRRSASKHAAAPPPSTVAARHSQPGSRRAPRRRRSFVPTPAVLGATALVIAGGGAVIVSSNSGGGSDEAYDTANTAQLSDGAGDYYARGGGVLPVSRSVDRDVLERQAEQQAQQMMAARAELANKAQQRAHELEANQWVLPVAGYVLTARYGEYSYLWSSYHTGLDFSAPEGTEIVSVAHGVVSDVGWDDAYGYRTEITLDNGWTIWYCHQSSYVVSEGEEVDPGQLIGYIGATGNVTGPHLHLEVRIPDGTEEGQDIDPYDALVQHGVTP
jgi:murein DD-endopeptidase MepM/ murein hydrolase activator NlpD